MDKKKANALYVILIIALIVFMVWIMFWLKSESSKCLENPVKYFTDKNQHVYCNCYDKETEIFIEGINEEVFRFDIHP